MSANALPSDHGKEQDMSAFAVYQTKIRVFCFFLWISEIHIWKCRQSEIIIIIIKKFKLRNL